jgi:hypothetical protein
VREAIQNYTSFGLILPRFHGVLEDKNNLIMTVGWKVDHPAIFDPSGVRGLSIHQKPSLPVVPDDEALLSHDPLSYEPSCARDGVERERHDALKTKAWHSFCGVAYRATSCSGESGTSAKGCRRLWSLLRNGQANSDCFSQERHQMSFSLRLVWRASLEYILLDDLSRFFPFLVPLLPRFAVILTRFWRIEEEKLDTCDRRRTSF